MKAQTLRTIAVITDAHGLKGDVEIKPFDEDASWLGHLSQVYMFKPSGPVEMNIQSGRWQGRRVILKFAGVETRDDAEKLKGFTLKAIEADLPELDEDEFYADSLVGLKVTSHDSGKSLGVVTEVLSSAAGDFLEIQNETLSEPILIPFQTVFIPSVDRDRETIFITGLDNLFEPATGS